MITYWRTESSTISASRLSPAFLRTISQRLQHLNGRFPSCFARQPRSLFESDRWKATEFRQFLLYSGIVVLRGVLSTTQYEHFLCLSVAMHILLEEDGRVRNHYLEYAENLLKSFVSYSTQVFGP
jgi:hypothetical protein